MSLLQGIDRVRDLLVENTARFAKGLPANNALLWGARGMGKSSLVKAAHAAIGAAHPAAGLKLIEIHREDIDSLPDLMGLLREAPQRFIVFCDDLSFDGDDTSYKSLKTMLEGGIEGRPDNVIFTPPRTAAICWRGHGRERTLDRDQSRRSRRGKGVAVGPVGLWLSFHRCSQDEFVAMVTGYVARYRIPIGEEDLRREALEWATTARRPFRPRRLAAKARLEDGKAGACHGNNPETASFYSPDNHSPDFGFFRPSGGLRILSEMRDSDGLQRRAGFQPDGLINFCWWYAIPTTAYRGHSTRPVLNRAAGVDWESEAVRSSLPPICDTPLSRDFVPRNRVTARRSLALQSHDRRITKF